MRQEEDAKAKARAEAEAIAKRETMRREALTAAQGRSLSHGQAAGRAKARSQPEDVAPRAAAGAADDVIVISDSDSEEPALRPEARVEPSKRQPAVGSGRPTGLPADPAQASSAAAAAATSSAAMTPAEQACHPVY